MPEKYDIPRSRDGRSVREIDPREVPEPRSAEELARALFYQNDKRYPRKKIKQG